MHTKNSKEDGGYIFPNHDTHLMTCYCLEKGMECSCGGEANFKEHKVIGADTVFEWTGVRLKQHEMPVMVGRNVCQSCGRQSKPTLRKIK